MDSTETTGLARSVALGVGVALLLGIAIAGGSILQGSGTDATAREALPYAGIGALAALVVLALAFAVWRSHSPGAARPHPMLVLAAVFVMGAIGALLGAAFTPDSPTADEVSPLSEDEIDRREQQYGELGDEAQAGTVDADGDGVPDRDPNGELIIAYDTDGDGRVDGYLQPCPIDSPRPSYEPRPGSTPIDVGCDGDIDEWVPFDPERVLRPDGAVPQPRPPSTIPRQDRVERAQDEASEGRSSFLTTLLIILAVVAVAAILIAIIVRWSDDDPDDAPADGADDEGAALPDLAPSIAATVDTLVDDPDPRAAICAAYGRLLDELARSGHARLPHEAPEEHLERVLARHRIDPTSVRRLLDLFALARFSSHPITEAHRRDALDALHTSLASASTPAMAGATPVPHAAS